ncbi:MULTISPECIES: manganese efflux pump MntP family protein [Clostridium]|uniref:Putative manganese efflux pump MntP n=1 Tax=Clostridium senegalense TaxID=1465809 RepID=A0A6M0H0D9_9CLOT|nr:MULTISPECIES: manganese efflux pump MntP family protein [Clostridium]NEU03658.1 manganese efflux pump [Clostridium senegalense]
MSIISIFLTALALAMDAFAVSLSIGMKSKNERIKNGLKAGLYFGIFQGAMPLIGWLLGIKFTNYIVKFDHWIAFILLAIIGGKMIYEAIKGEESDITSDLSVKVMTILAIATSIDALAVGVSFAFLNVSIVLAASSIAIITFIACFIGVFIGQKLGDVLGGKAEFLGGIILILIGTKILLEHLGIL